MATVLSESQRRFLERLLAHGPAILFDGSTRISLEFTDGEKVVYRTTDYFLERTGLVERYHDGDIQLLRITAAGEGAITE